jgi:4-hydroxyphenylpyruvate dioxygenase
MKMKIEGIDHLEIYVGNSLQAAHFYRTVLGFTPIAYSGPETGSPDRASYLVSRGNMRLMLTAPVTPGSEIAEFLGKHGEGVHDIAFSVCDASVAFHTALERGAGKIAAPHVLEDESGRAVLSCVAAFGDTVHTFIERGDFRGRFLPGFRDIQPRAIAETGLQAIDHFAVCIEQGLTDQWVEHYTRVFDMEMSREEKIETEHSAMFSKVVETADRTATFVFVEPVPGKRKSPIAEFLKYNDGPGVHHVAVTAENILHSVRTLQNNGLQFTRTPAPYYSTLAERVGPIAEDLVELRDLGILVDREEDGYLMQIFSQPLQNRPTFFFEIIQRAGALGFGSGNIKALFQAIERAQAERGNA